MGISCKRSELIENMEGEKYIINFCSTEYNKEENEKMRPILLQLNYTNTMKNHLISTICVKNI